MIDDYRDEPSPKPICLLELAALNPLPEGAEEAELQRLEEQEAWYAGLNLHREVFVLPLKAACDITPMGWQELLFKTQIKLKSTIGEDLQRQHLYDSAKVWASDEELEFKLADGRGCSVFRDRSECHPALPLDVHRMRSPWTSSRAWRRLYRHDVFEVRVTAAHEATNR